MKFAKYLPRYGIEPIVLTRRNVAFHSFDEELQNEVSKIKIIKTESFDPARILYILGMRIYRPKAWHMPIKESINFPDNKLPWAPFAFVSAKKLKFDIFGTTLTISPHKNSNIINSIGLKLAAGEGIGFYQSDLKKKEGFKKTIELSKRLKLYRQNYCGCIYSMK